jgi:hypothetical protein
MTIGMLFLPVEEEKKLIIAVTLVPRHSLSYKPFFFAAPLGTYVTLSVT